MLWKFLSDKKIWLGKSMNKCTSQGIENLWVTHISATNFIKESFKKNALIGIA